MALILNAILPAWAAPDRLHVVVNAADGYGRFERLGLQIRVGDELTTRNVRDLLAAEVGRMHTFGAWAIALDTEVLFKVSDVSGDELDLKLFTEPPIDATYRVAHEPPPHVAEPHGDYVFELQLC